MKTEHELKQIILLLARKASFDEFPDGVTWADLEAAERYVKEKQNAR